jgi:predicted nucleotidyltransferase
MRSAIAGFVSRVRAALVQNLVEVRLLGSRARGDSQPHSDIDIALIVEADRGQAGDIAIDIASDVNVASDLYISQRVIDRSVLSHPVWRTTGFVQALEREGIALSATSRNSRVDARPRRGSR